MTGCRLCICFGGGEWRGEEGLCCILYLASRGVVVGGRISLKRSSRTLFWARRRSARPFLYSHSESFQTDFNYVSACLNKFTVFNPRGMLLGPDVEVYFRGLRRIASNGKCVQISANHRVIPRCLHCLYK